MIPTFEQCMAEVRAKRVTYRESNDGNFCVFNYAPEVEFKKLWNGVNIWCRGLIFDCADTKAPVAVPFKKFWNVGQKPQTQPDVLAAKGLPVSIAQKVDGSLGIVHWDKYRAQARVSTRGSLESDQALWATAWLNDNISSDDECLLRKQLQAGQTYLVEIVYPENRIVVRYDFAGLVLLDVVQNATGETDTQHGSQSFAPAAWRRATTFAIDTVSALICRAKDLSGMEEGFVCTYADGLKVKIKGDEYIRLHRIRFDMTPRRVHELLANCDGNYNAALEMLLKAAPDEFADLIFAAGRELVRRYHVHRQDVKWHVETAQADARGERKRMALYCQKNLDKSLWSAFFTLLDDEQEKFKTVLWNATEYKDIAI